MFPLIETALAFSVIMLMISFLVKSLASVVKNHMAYYSDNLQYEVRRLLLGIVDQIQLKAFLAKVKGAGESAELKRVSERSQGLLDWLSAGKLESAGIPWNSLGEEFLNAENVRKLLTYSGCDPGTVDDLEGRIALHQANLKYAFERRMKNLTLVCGLALCFALNINAFTIWSTLYNDTDLRAKYAATGKVDEVLRWYDDKLKDTSTVAGVGGTMVDDERKVERKKLEDEREAFKNEVLRFKEEVNFGIGAIWNSSTNSEGTEKKDVDFSVFLYRAVWEFLGSLLTGVFVSIGAPYLHEFVRLISTFNKGRTATAS